MRSRFPRLLLLGLACAATACAEPVFLEGKEIPESSGLARSHRVADRLWTINDSGNAPILFAIDPTGKISRRLTLPKVRNQDWESLCSFILDDKPYLLVADVGDNNRRRNNCRLLLFHEPDDQAPATVITIPISYADGPRDCEAVAVDPHRREILLLEKHNRNSATLYVAPLPTGPRTLVAQPLAQVPVTLATGMDLSPDGLTLLVVTYGHAFLFQRPNRNSSWAKHLAKRRQLTLPPRAQGETICFAPDGKSVFLTSERLPATLHQVPLPTLVLD